MTHPAVKAYFRKMYRRYKAVETPANRKRRLERARKMCAKYRKKHPEKIRRTQHAWYMKNKAKSKRQATEWRKAHRDLVNARARERYARKKRRRA